jgi:hypothetical protein
MENNRSLTAAALKLFGAARLSKRSSCSVEIIASQGSETID